MKTFKYILLVNILSLIMSLDFDHKYFFDFNRFLVLNIVNFLYIKDIINYFYGKDFWSLGVRPKSTDGSFYRFYWFLLLIFMYFLTIYAVVTMVG